LQINIHDILIDTSVLPSNVMLLRDEKFINFVKEEAGHAATALHEAQGINCVKSLLMTTDIYASHFSLIEGQHYFISILNDANCILKGDIKCCCQLRGQERFYTDEYSRSHF
jgi:hypothetical protein